MPWPDSTALVAADIARLTSARKLGPDRWLGHCPGPAHRRGDRHGSLNIRQVGDRKAIHCFVCGSEATPQIVGALGLTMGALFRPLTPADRMRMHQQRRVQQRIEERQA